MRCALLLWFLLGIAAPASATQIRVRATLFSPFYGQWVGGAAVDQWRDRCFDTNDIDLTGA